MKLFAIDDDKTSLLLVESMAGEIGFDVTSSLSPIKALERIQNETFDLILVDYMMPEMNGIECIERIRVDHPGIPIIMITGTIEDDALKLDALKAGATEFINKPIDVAEFRARLRNLSALRRAQLLLSDRAMLLEEEVATATRNIVEREYETLTVLGRAAEYRDPETAAHISRVAHYSRLIAEACGEGADTLDILFYAAPLHDIGKIGISDTILLKPGKLTQDEFELIKGHTTIGSNIIRRSSSEYLKAGSIIALAHHEWFNGNGYPRGISGDEIPLFGRIVAIADVFDALTSTRPYKEPWPMDRAFEHIREMRGKHFDPELTSHFLERDRMVESIYSEFSDQPDGGTS